MPGGILLLKSDLTIEGHRSLLIMLLLIEICKSPSSAKLKQQQTQPYIDLQKLNIDINVMFH